MSSITIDTLRRKVADLDDVLFITGRQARDLYTLAKYVCPDHAAMPALESAAWDIVLGGGCPNRVYNIVAAIAADAEK